MTPVHHRRQKLGSRIEARGISSGAVDEQVAKSQVTAQV